MEKRTDNGNARETPGDAAHWLGPASGDGERPDEFDLLLCLRVLLSYWWILAPLAVIGAGAGVAFWLHMLPVYQANCRFEIFQNTDLGIGEESRGRGYEPMGLYRHILIMKSNKLNQEVVRELTAQWGERIPTDFLRYAVNVAPVKDAPGSMVDISIHSFSPDYSLDYLNKLVEGYQGIRREETSLLNESTLSNLRREQINLAKQLEKSENDIAEFESQHNIIFVHEKSKSDQALLTALMGRQSQLRTQLAILETQYPFLKDENAATLRDVLELTNQLSRMKLISEAGGTQDLPLADSGGEIGAAQGWSEIPEWRKNEATILRMNAEYDTMLKVYKPGHPKMLALQEQIAAAKRELTISAQISLKRLQSIQHALHMQEEALLKTAQSFRMEINLSAGERAEYDKLKRRQEHLKRLHDQVFTRIIDSSAANKDQYYSRFVDGPAASKVPVWPIKWKVISVAIGGCTGAGAIIILLSYFIRVRLYDYQSLERTLNLACLAGVPKFKIKGKGKKRGLEYDLVLENKSDFASECYRSLRTNIENRMSENDKVILVTSPDPGEGKTFTVINLAIVFSWNRKKVLLIDGDFRRMTLRRYFRDTTKVGLTDWLISETATADQFIHRNVLEGVDYLPAGIMSQHTTELLTMPRYAAILAELREQYDLILIDSAPVNRVVDTIVLAKYADTILLVARAGKTKIPAVRYCHNRLSTGNIIGYVLNNIDAASRKYGYYNYSYTYYSAYHQYKTYEKSYPPLKEKPA